MDTKFFLEFQNIDFSYKQNTGTNTPQNSESLIFQNFNATFPSCFMSLVGPNGSGKSTFILLASGRIKPQHGTILLFNQNPHNLTKDKKNELASIIYQNMEFETTATTYELFETIYANGNHVKNRVSQNFEQGIFAELQSTFQLKNLFNRPLQKLSKGEMQRCIIAFSLLYGSKTIFMDEPFFAMEENQKRACLEYLRNYSTQYKTPICVAMHELSLTKKYFTNTLLFYPNRDMDFGSPEEVLTPESLEKAYKIPFAMLKDHEKIIQTQLREQQTQ